MKPVCVPCERFMRMKKSGYYFIEGMPEASSRPEIGKGAVGWKPYKVWSGDLYHCPTCHAETIMAPWDLPLLGAHQAALGAYINELTRNAIMHGPSCPCVNCT